MNAKGHVNFAAYTVVCLGIGLVSSTLIGDVQWQDAATWSGGVVIGSLLPDLDHKGSTLGSLFPIIPHLHKKFKKWFKWHFLRHGGITHTVLVNLWIFVLAWYLKSGLTLGIGVGYATHLYIDHVTGYPLAMLYWPLKTKRGWFK